MVSEDGIHVKQAKKQIHCSENPSIYADKDGGLVRYAGYGVAGVWCVPCIDGPWTKAETDMPVSHRWETAVNVLQFLNGTDINIL